MRITAAACRIDRSRVFTDYTHTDAFFLAVNTGLVAEEDFLGPRHEEGFVTNTGQFLLRDAAFELAKTNHQATQPDAEYLDALEVEYA